MKKNKFVAELNELIEFFANRDIEAMMEDSTEFQKLKEKFIKKYFPKEKNKNGC